MHFTTFFSGLGAALIFSENAAANTVAARSAADDVCNGESYSSYAPLATYSAAQAFCSSVYQGSTVTQTVTTTAITEASSAHSFGAYVVVSVTETSTAVVADVTPANAKRSYASAG